MSYAQYSFGRTYTFGAAPSREARLARLDALATLMDTAFIIPGSNVRFGLDALIGLVPAIGDAITTAISLYIVHEARQLGAPRHVVLRMLGNVALDGLVGAVPLVGDAFDVIWRANRRNMRLLQEWLARTERRRSEHTEAWWPSPHFSHYLALQQHLSGFQRGLVKVIGIPDAEWRLPRFVF